MIEQQDWELLDLGLRVLPGLSLVVYRTEEGDLLPRMVAQPTGATIYAAAWRDHSGKVLEWLDLWIQDVSAWEAGTGSLMINPSNSALDRHWRNWCRGMAVTHPGKVLDFGFDQHPAPVIWLGADGRSLYPASKDWSLCTDDTVLRGRELPHYSDSLHRYLWNGSQTAPRFIPLSPDAPHGPDTALPADVFANAIPVNPGGSLMLLCRSYSIPLGDFANMLANEASGQDLSESMRTPPVYGNLRLPGQSSNDSNVAGLFFQSEQVVGHLGEILHLKLSVIYGVLQATANAIRETGCPFFGLTTDDFGVTFPQGETSLPFLWSHRVSLEAPPSCVSTLVGDIGMPIFLPTPGLGHSIYRSPKVLTEIRGLAKVRIGAVSHPDDCGLVIMEGTLLSEEPLDAGPRDLVEMVWKLPGHGLLRLYATVDGRNNLSRGEYQFRSLQTLLRPEIYELLGSGRGTIASDRVAFHFLPRIGTPCDLYSVGVIGLRILLLHPDGLSATLGDLLALARKYRTRYGNANWSTGNVTLGEFARTGEAGEVVNRLGPQWLAPDLKIANCAADDIPTALWWDTIDFLSRLFPGIALGSFCKDNDDFESRAPHEAFTAPIAAVEMLLARSRDLLFGSPAANREVRLAIQRAKAEQTS